MKNNNSLVSVKKVLKMINSCQTEEQLESCKDLIDNYIKSAKKNKVINISDLSNRLHEELIQRQEQVYLVKIFNI